MHIMITGDVNNVNRIFQYCQQYNITMYYGRIDHEIHDLAWQIVHDACPRLDILLMLFPGELRVLSPF